MNINQKEIFQSLEPGERKRLTPKPCQKCGRESAFFGFTGNVTGESPLGVLFYCPECWNQIHSGWLSTEIYRKAYGRAQSLLNQYVGSQKDLL